jgi:hypothetical protein
MLQQHCEDSKGLFGDTNRFRSVLAQFTGAQVEFKGLETSKPLEVFAATLAPLGT